MWDGHILGLKPLVGGALLEGGCGGWGGMSRGEGTYVTPKKKQIKHTT